MKQVTGISRVIMGVCFVGLFLAKGYGQEGYSLNADSTFTNMAAGEFTPGKGFQLVKSKYASLNLSIYGMARYLNQISSDSTYEDHLGNVKDFNGRNDIYWHRAMLWFKGFFWKPQLTYAVTVWTVTTTQQTLVFGTLAYTFNKQMTFGVGMMPNVCIRSVQGSFPLFSSTDRTMAEDGLRGGFTNGVFLTGEALPRFRYTLAYGDNLSILGIKASNLKRHFSKSISLEWLPTTGEFGPRGGNGDFEHHDKIATRFGTSFCHSRENRFNNTGTPSPDNTQVRMSDGGLFFETGALAPGATVIEANYDLLAVDLGFKYKGLAVHTEFYYRTLTKFSTDAPVPINSIKDKGYTAQVLYMLIPKTLCIYGINSMIIDQFERNPFEVGGGVNIYPSKTRSFRINAQATAIQKGAAGGTFGLYTTGHTGTTITIGADILL